MRSIFPLYFLWAIVGWCGTPWPYWWPFPWPRPEPPPPPDPWWLPRFIGVVAGLVGGWAFTQVFEPNPSPWISALPAAASAVGAFAASRLVGDIYGLARGAGKGTGN